MRFSDLAAVSEAVTATRSRSGKAGLLAGALRQLTVAEIPAGVAYLSGELRQRQIGVGWASLRSLPPGAAHATLTVTDVDRTLAQVGAEHGAGSTARRRDLLSGLFAAATGTEQRFLRGLLTGELRQGALAGVMADAVARAAELDPIAVRRALLLSGDLREVAAAALSGGAAALARFRLSVGRPVAPMLAQTAATVADAVATTATGSGGQVAVDDKLDGIRIQVHRAGDDVSVFTRSLDDITSRVPEIVAAVRALPVGQLVLDGEALALTDAGRPMPFQVTAGRAGRRSGAAQHVLHPFFFDLLHLDGADLLDEPAARRFDELAGLLPEAVRVGRRVLADPTAAAERFAAVLAAGHEGVVVKALDARYEAGRRGGGWLKVKPRHTLDLVVLAAEWGHGRRRGVLSNLHLGARGPDGDFVMLGKTFKGLTDAVLAWQTDRLLGLAERRDEHVVWVRPEQVVEIAFDGVQRSSRYPAGLTLRFARVVRYRQDKSAAEADTVDAVRAIWRAGGGDPTASPSGA